MKYKLSEKVNALKPSIIREILKQMSDPTLISFAGGSPSALSFPVDAIKKYSAELLENDPLSVMQYSITEGYSPLIDTVSKFANRKFNVKKDADSVIITSGSQQIIDFMTKCLCNEGDIIACEDVAFLGALNTFKSYGAILKGVKNDATNSIDLEHLEYIFKTFSPKFFYTIPNFQNPTGYTMPLEKRKAVYNLACKYNVPILEDDPYGQIRFNGEELPPIKSFDNDNAVIYAGSLSKILCPGFRVAYAIGSNELLKHMVIAKQGSDIHTNIWAQRVCNEILTKEDMEEHIKKIAKIYKKNCDLMIDNMNIYFSPKVKYQKPDGGMFIWVTMPDNVDVMGFINEALENKVAIIPGSAFLSDENALCQSFRMNFSTPTEENIVKGVKILGDLTKKYCG